jgi:hypothetical protein
MSRGHVTTLPLHELDTTPHDGHAAAAGSSVTTRTTRAPSDKRSTRCTRTPGSPNNNVVPPTTALGCFRLKAWQPSDSEDPRASYCNDTPNEGDITSALSRSKSRHSAWPSAAHAPRRFVSPRPATPPRSTRVAVTAHEQRVATPAVAQLSGHPVPELRALALLDPDAQQLLDAVDVDADHLVGGLIGHHTRRRGS